jgi:hypothetical protein
VQDTASLFFVPNLQGNVMINVPIEYFDYLHDAEVSTVTLKTDDSGNNQLVLGATCNSDCGLEVWNGKCLQIHFEDTLVVHLDFYGHTLNVETIDSWSFNPSSRLTSSINQLISLGTHSPKATVLITLHSGSCIEIACAQISVKI